MLCALAVFSGLIACSAPQTESSRYRAKFDVRCDSSAAVCQVNYDGKSLVKMEGLTPDFEPYLEFLGAFGDEREVFLIDESRGDGCPSMHYLIDVDAAGARITEPFGNCDGPQIAITPEQTIRLDFAASPEAKREAMSFVYKDGKFEKL